MMTLKLTETRPIKLTKNEYKRCLGKDGFELNKFFDLYHYKTQETHDYVEYSIYDENNVELNTYTLIF